jgi:hypothetical protein
MHAETGATFEGGAYTILALDPAETLAILLASAAGDDYATVSPGWSHK